MARPRLTSYSNQRRQRSSAASLSRFVCFLLPFAPFILQCIKYKHLFDLLDSDGSGAIGHHELKEAFHRVGSKASDKALDTLISLVDSDGNGEIDFFGS